LGDSVTVEKLGENVEQGMVRGLQNYRKLLQSEGLFRKGPKLESKSANGNALGGPLAAPTARSFSPSADPHFVG
jgi:hypothetical protein